MNPSDDSLDPRLEEKLSVLLTVAPRDPGAAARGRANYLSQAGSLKTAVSESSQRRHRRWMSSFLTIFSRREHSPMLATLTSILMIVSILLGGTGITVYAAQDSLPDQPLYGVKTWSEDFRVGLTNDLQSKLNLDLELANRRVEEMVALSASGVTPSDVVLARLENHLDQTLHLAAGLDDDGFAPAMEKVRQTMQIQERELIQAQVQAATPAEAQLARARDMIQARLRLVEDGLQDPVAFRERLRTREQLQIRQETCTPTGEGNQQRQQQGGPVQTQASEGFDPGPNSSATLGSGSGYDPGPYVTGAPTPGSGYGPGPDPQPSAAPQSGAGNSSDPGPTAESGGPQDPGPNPPDGSGGHNSPGPNPSGDGNNQGGSASQETSGGGSGNGGGGGRP